MNPSLVSHLRKHMGGTTTSTKAFKRTMSANYLVKHTRDPPAAERVLAAKSGDEGAADEGLRDLDEDAWDDLARAGSRADGQRSMPANNAGSKMVRPGTAVVSRQQRPLTAVSTTLTITGDERLGSASVSGARPVTAKHRQPSVNLAASGLGVPSTTPALALPEDSREEDSSADLVGPPEVRRSVHEENQSLEAAINLSLPQTDARSELFGANLIRDLDPIHELKAKYEKNPKAVVEENFVRMKNLAAMLNLTQTEREKTREEMLEQERKKTDPKMFKGRYADFEPVMPWEKVSIYRDGEPEYNDPVTSFDYQPEPVIDIKPEKEEEIRKLMEGLYEKFDFYKKYTNIEYDEECKYLKVESAKLALYEVNRIRRQYQNKSLQKPFDIEMVEEIVNPLPFFMKFDSEVRKQILSKAELVEYPAGHTVFKQGDYGDKMYIILQGSVNVMIHYSDPITAKPMRQSGSLDARWVQLWRVLNARLEVKDDQGHGLHVDEQVVFRDQQPTDLPEASHHLPRAHRLEGEECRRSLEEEPSRRVTAAERPFVPEEHRWPEGGSLPREDQACSRHCGHREPFHARVVERVLQRDHLDYHQRRV